MTHPDLSSGTPPTTTAETTLDVERLVPLLHGIANGMLHQVDVLRSLKATSPESLLAPKLVKQAEALFALASQLPALTARISELEADKASLGRIYQQMQGACADANDAVARLTQELETEKALRVEDLADQRTEWERANAAELRAEQADRLTREVARLTQERDEARRTLSGAVSPPDANGVRTICLGYHEETQEYEWLEVVPKSAADSQRRALRELANPVRIEEIARQLERVADEAAVWRKPEDYRKQLRRDADHLRAVLRALSPDQPPLGTEEPQ